TNENMRQSVLHHAGVEHPHDERGDRDEEDRPRPDEAVGFRRHVEDRGELVHQRDEAGGEPGEVPLAALREAEEPLALDEDGEEREQPDVQPEEGEERHARPSTSKSWSSAATPSARVPSTARPRAFEAGSTQRRKPCRAASRRRASERPTARTSPVRPTSPHTATSATSARPGARAGRAARKAAEGFGTSSSPPSPISNTATSLVEPNRFLTARSTRSACAPSPSK